MIRFRLGQSWKREKDASLADSFGLDLDGVDLLPQASEESLAVVVPELVDAVSALYLNGDPLAQVSLAEAHLEIALLRRENDVELTIVDLGRPARVARGPIRVELAELAAAAVKCARTLMRALRGWAPPLQNSAPIQRMMRQLQAIEHGPMASSLRGSAVERAHFHSGPAAPNSFAFELADSQSLLTAFGRAGRGALTSLLVEGSVGFAIEPGNLLWRAVGRPFLLALEICRQAGELARALDLGERQLSLQLAGVGPSLELDLIGGRLAVSTRECELAGAQLARAMFDLGLSLAFLAFAQNRNQKRNPYLTGLIERCREGLAQLRAPVEPSEDRVARARGDRALTYKAVNRTGQLRRLRFTELWKKTRLGGDEPGRILVGARGPIFSSASMACAFSTGGDLLFRRISTHGVAAGEDQWLLAASSKRIECFVGSEKSARWMRDHDGLPIGPSLDRKGGLLVGTSSAGVVFALSELTGRELWRIAPSRARVVFAAIQGHRALVAADSGHLYGLDLADGRVRYRLHAALPFTSPPLAWGRKLLARAGRRERFSLLAADAHRGTLHWNRELDLNSTSVAMVQRNRVFVAGARAAEGVLLCLGSMGQPLWERRLHLGRGPFTLLAAGAKMIACSPRGGAVCFGTDGQLLWRLGGLSGELLWPCPPAFARGVAIIPGEAVRAVDVESGEILAELRSGIGLCDLKTDSKLNLFLLDEDGTLQAHRLASHFAVVAGDP